MSEIDEIVPPALTEASIEVEEAPEHPPATEHEQGEHEASLEQHHAAAEEVHHEQEHHEDAHHTHEVIETDAAWICNPCQIYNHASSEICISCHQVREQVEQRYDAIDHTHLEAPAADVETLQQLPQEQQPINVDADTHDGTLRIPEDAVADTAQHWVQAAAAPAPAPQHDWVAEGTWFCPKCGRANLPSKARCGSCQAWKNGERLNLTRRKAAVVTESQEPWACHGCGNSNGAKKVRCSSCQKWKGGKRIIPGWGSYTPTNLVPVIPEPKLAWTCDKCGNENEGSKVRCCHCPRWKNGKRPNLQKTYQQPFGAHPPVAGGSPHYMPPQPPEPNWLCPACGNSNLGIKARCSNCQKWKGGKRENVGKGSAVKPAVQTEAQMQEHIATLVTQPTAHPMQGEILVWLCEGCGHHNQEPKARCGSCQRWKGGKRQNTGRKTTNLIMAPPVLNQPNVPWNCAKCGISNNATKLRCAGCQSWKNGRRQIQAQHYQQQLHTPQHVQMGKPQNVNVPALPPASPAENWVCSCGNVNQAGKLRCGSCQAWKKGKKNMQHQAQTQVAYQQMLTAPMVDPPAQLGPMIPQLPWNCHKCGKSNLANKSRCGSCQAWKGGVRNNIGAKKVVETWPCDKCGRVNAGNKVRCGECQRWKGGGRPDVLARKAEKALNPNNQWPCDSCGKPNKASKVRCGNCQRWRGGMRPNIRKTNPVLNMVLPTFRVPPDAKYSSRPPALPPSGPSGYPAPAPMANQASAMEQQVAVAPSVEAAPPSAYTEAVVPTETIEAPAPADALVVPTEDAHATVVDHSEPKSNDGSWICDKCTCDNLASETKCKICDAAKSDKVIV